MPQLLASSLEAAINRVLALDPAAADRLVRLEGKTLGLELEGLGIDLFFTTRHGAVHVGLDSAGEPDARVRGTPLALFAMATPGDGAHWGSPESSVHISGDAALARDLERLFRELDPDWEGQMAVLLGDVLGFQFASGLRRGADFLREALRQAADARGRHADEATAPVVQAREFREFARGIGELGRALDELETKLKGQPDDAE